MKLFYIHALLLLSITKAKAQENSVTSGGDASGAGGTVTFSIGQVFYGNTVDFDGNSINEGVQQPYVVEVVTSIQTENIEIELFPNPTTDLAYLKFKSGRTISDLTYSLTDIHSRIISNKTTLSENNEIDLSALANGVYLLNVRDEKQTIKSFRIIKNK